MSKLALVITQSKLFQYVIMGVILFAAVLVGLETSPTLFAQNKPIFLFFDHVVQIIFTIEIILRILSYGKNFLKFFQSGNNLFDFVITALFYMPFGGVYISVFRLFRVFRIFRLITALPRLQVLVGALIKSVPSIGYVALLMFIQFYIFAVIGNFQFGHIDPDNFGNLGKSMMTLFQIITLEGWVEIYKNVGTGLASTAYFVTFILLGTMIILNLFIGVIMNGFDEVKKEVEEASEDESTQIGTDLKKLESQLNILQQDLSRIVNKSKKKKK